MDDLVIKADNAMYKAKKLGKNKYVFSSKVELELSYEHNKKKYAKTSIEANFVEDCGGENICVKV